MPARGRKLEAGRLDQAGRRSGAIVGPLEMTRHRCCIGEHVDDPDFPAGLVDVRAEQRGPRLGRFDESGGRLQPAFERGPIPLDDPAGADEHDWVVHAVSSRVRRRFLR
jgi:hypothetical protein